MAGHSHAHHGHHRPAGRGKLLLVTLFNAAITVAEFIGGVLAGSLALVSDAWHNLSDVLSLMLGYAGEKVSQRERTSRYTFGLKRFEVLVALINALGLLAIGIYIVYEAIQRFADPLPINIGIMIPVSLIGLAGNVFSILVLLKNRKDSLNMKAAFLHLFYDALSSIAVLAAGIILYFTGYAWIDLAVSLMIVIMISWSSMEIIRESLRIFLQGVPAGINTQEVYRDISAIRGVASVHGLHIWSVSSTEVFLSCHICADSDSGLDADDLIKGINAMLEKNYGISHTTLQIETTLLCSINPHSCCE